MSSVGDCCYLCDQYPTCTNFTYRSDTGKCNLFTSGKGVTLNESCISGGSAGHVWPLPCRDDKDCSGHGTCNGGACNCTGGFTTATDERRARLGTGLVAGLFPFLLHMVLVGPRAMVEGMVVDPVVRLRAGRRLPLPPAPQSQRQRGALMAGAGQAGGDGPPRGPGGLDPQQVRSEGIPEAPRRQQRPRRPRYTPSPPFPLIFFALLSPHFLLLLLLCCCWCWCW